MHVTSGYYMIGYHGNERDMQYIQLWYVIVIALLSQSDLAFDLIILYDRPTNDIDAFRCR